MSAPPPNPSLTVHLTLPLRIWRGLTHLGNPLLGAHLRSRVKRGKEEEARLSERRGITNAVRPAGKLLWIHAASVGESLSVLPLINAVLAQDEDLSVLITTGTVTSAKLLEEQLPPRAQHQYVPLDRVNSVRRFLDHWKPDAGIWVESELWPTLLTESKSRGIPLGLVNARMSKKSARGWKRLPRTAAQMLGAFDVILAQDNITARRLSELGAGHLLELGNLKLAADPLPADEGELARLRDAIGNRPVWIAASTHKEEEIIASAHQHLEKQLPNVLSIIVPRQPRRFDVVEQELVAAGLKVARRSRGDAIAEDTQVYLADTMGEMGLFLRLGAVAFLGRSLFDKGGSNPLEPARLNCAIVHGPYIENFDDLYEKLRAIHGARAVEDVETLAQAVADLLADEPARAAQITAALTLVAEAHEVLAETSKAVIGLLPSHPTLSSTP